MDLEQLVPVAFPALLAVASLYSGWRLRRRSGQRTTAGRVPLRRPNRWGGVTLLVTQLSLAVWLAAIHYQKGWTFASIGFSGDVAPALALGAGFACYPIFLLIVNAALRRAGVLHHVDDAGLVGLTRVVPRRRMQKAMASLGIIALNPITEEMLFRGLLVHQLALAVNSLIVAALVGLAANVANHAYQGRWAQLFHVPFFAATVGLLYSPLGLLGAIGFHLGGDLIPLAMLRRHVAAYRDRHRRPAATSAPIC